MDFFLNFGQKFIKIAFANKYNSYLMTNDINILLKIHLKGARMAACLLKTIIFFQEEGSFSS